MGTSFFPTTSNTSKQPQSDHAYKTPPRQMMQPASKRSRTIAYSCGRCEDLQEDLNSICQAQDRAKQKLKTEKQLRVQAEEKLRDVEAKAQDLSDQLDELKISLQQAQLRLARVKELCDEHVEEQAKGEEDADLVPCSEHEESLSLD
ncbi:hypothetical protein BD324DRAFT_626646 [Kockovaella imperatae]|uniref:Uncharacterized protein n=1 Tax=Kockovaella imperatae TaxID=4999 RepID=A0A1Y1UF04_9TREE|nr:hypothetical protein BD324DRAFT_626646 [Kockovaella imperatae]ORX36640.1 hypothetical protein BD324DRAFT_626646 [Kockovaella imperatae]